MIYMKKKGGSALVEKRRSAHLRFHEQGCLNQFYSHSPHYRENIVLIPAEKLRRINMQKPMGAPIFHVFCKKRAAQVADMKRCLSSLVSKGMC